METTPTPSVLDQRELDMSRMPYQLPFPAEAADEEDLRRGADLDGEGHEARRHSADARRRQRKGRAVQRRRRREQQRGGEGGGGEGEHSRRRLFVCPSASGFPCPRTLRTTDLAAGKFARAH